MVASNFAPSLAYVRSDEGGNDDDPDDPGGRTSRGIIQREYDAWRLSKGLPTRDVWTATDDEINQIYHDQYWEPWCDGFPIALDYLFFDMDVNMGQHEATLLLQRGLGVIADGKIGIVTKAALQDCDPETVIDAITAAKSTFYHQLRTWWKYGKGWTARYMRAAQRAKAMLKLDAVS